MTTVQPKESTKSDSYLEELNILTPIRIEFNDGCIYHTTVTRLDFITRKHKEEHGKRPNTNCSSKTEDR